MLHFALRRSQNIHWQALDVDQARAGRDQGPEALRALVHRAVRRRQVDDRQPGREEAARAGRAHLPARRRQRAPRAQQGPGLHRRGPRREHPPRRRGGDADGRCRPDRADRVHLAVPRRAADGAGLAAARASSSRCSSTRRSRWPSSATPKGLYKKARRGELKNFTGIDSPYEPPEAPEITIASAECSSEEAAEHIVEELQRRGVTDGVAAAK